MTGPLSLTLLGGLLLGMGPQKLDFTWGEGAFPAVLDTGLDSVFEGRLNASRHHVIGGLEFTLEHGREGWVYRWTRAVHGQKGRGTRPTRWCLVP